MQKLIIRNLGPIKQAEIELKPYTIFVGESGTGKSVILRTISLLRYIHKQMRYKVLLKKSKINSDALRFRLGSLLKQSLLDEFFNKNTYVELQEYDTSIVVIENLKLKAQYKNIDKSKYIYIDKIVFLNDIRSSLPEILSSSGGRRAKFSYFTNDMIENFFESFNENKKFHLSTMDINLTSNRRVGYEQFYIVNKEKEIKFESASSGEKNSIILELICTYYAQQYTFSKSFRDAVIEFIINKADVNLEKLQSYLEEKEIKNFLNIIIEEPETNLFPTNQKNIVYFLSSLRKEKNEPNIIFSTHSPYILTALNNLLYANRLEKKIKEKEKIYNIINKKYIIEQETFTAYLVENNSIKNIFDEKIGLIDAEVIDNVSGKIMQDFESLLELDNA